MYDFYQQYICSTVHMYDFFCEKKKHNMAKMAVIKKNNQSGRLNNFS